ncbi:MAG: TlpA family protein disulfide reductase [Spirochaetales bacterium]|nr:TlpA family protein disulfide reductase [Spirochaetales bacterium]
MKKTIFITVFIMIALFSFADSLKKTMETNGLYVFEKPIDIVDFKLEDVDGKIHKLSDYNGQVVFLNFWASWCGPCRSEMPSMQELQNKYKDKGFVILAVNLRESAKTTSDFMKRNKLDFTVLLDKDGSVGATYSARSIPTTYIIDRNSKVIGGMIGAREWTGDGIEKAIEEILTQ